MELRKKLSESYRVITDVITLKIENFNVNVWDYYILIKTDRKENGRYMIKKQSLKYLSYREYKAYRKTYFCYADAGIAFTLTRKDKRIFYLNNYAKILRLAKYLTTSNDELVSIVDRHSGKETYILTKMQGMIHKSNIIVN